MPTKSQPTRSRENQDTQDSDYHAAPPAPVTAPVSQAAPVPMMHEFGAISIAPSVQLRSPDEEFEPRREPEPDSLPGHKAGDDWWGLTHYGAFGGPGSLRGTDTPAIDGMDEVFRQHDANYGRVGVSSDSMWSMDSLVKSRDADRMLYDGVDQEMDTNGDSYSSGARLFGQGAKGIFGARSGVADGYQWGQEKWGDLKGGVSDGIDQAADWTENKGNEALTGIETGIDQASDWAGNKGSEAFDGVSDSASQAMNWTENKGSEATSGISGFLGEASQWDSLGDVAGGLWGGAKQAGSWLGDTFSEAKEGITDKAGDAASWMGNTASEAVGGVSDAAGDVADWGSSTASEAYNGITEAGGNALNWTKKTGMEAASGLSNAASGVAGWAGDTMGAAGNYALDKAGEFGGYVSNKTSSLLGKQDSWQRNALSLAADFVPGIGTAKGIQEAWSGKDLITGENLSTFGRVMSGVSAIPGIGTLLGKAGKFGAKSLGKLPQMEKLLTKTSKSFSKSNTLKKAGNNALEWAAKQIRPLGKEYSSLKPFTKKFPYGVNSLKKRGVEFADAGLKKASDLLGATTKRFPKSVNDVKSLYGKARKIPVLGQTIRFGEGMIDSGLGKIDKGLTKINKLPKAYETLAKPMKTVEEASWKKLFKPSFETLSKQYKRNGLFGVAGKYGEKFGKATGMIEGKSKEKQHDAKSST